MSFLSAFKKQNIPAEQHAGLNNGFHILAYSTALFVSAVYDMAIDGEIDVTKLQRTLPDDLVAIAKQAHFSQLAGEDFSDLPEDEQAEYLRHDLQTGWIEYLPHAVMHKHGATLAPEDITNPIQTFGEKFATTSNDLDDLNHIFYDTILAFMGTTENTLPPGLVVSIILYAHENKMIDGYSFSQWFTQARANLPDETYHAGLEI